MPDLFEVHVPGLGESVSEATIARWAKADGEFVAADDVIAELETDKASVEMPAGKAGTLKIVTPKGATVAVGALIAQIDPAGKPTSKNQAQGSQSLGSPPAPPTTQNSELRTQNFKLDDLSPAVRALVVENKLQNTQIPATGPGGRLTKEDVLAYLNSFQQRDAAAAALSQKQQAPDGFLSAAGTTAVPARPPTPQAQGLQSLGKTQDSAAAPARPLAAGEEREELSKLRQTIARRLVEAQHATASLTTFNEVDMSAVLALREKYKEAFEKQYGIGLGFMSFFAKAVIYAFQSVPQVNWTLDGATVIKRRAVHLGIAVSTDRGLMVPVIRNADALSMAQIENEIKRLATKARDGKISVDDMIGGTFTITNGGVFGSLLSTPILNPPQSGILGMHKIQKRPVVITEPAAPGKAAGGGGDTIAIRPMMYLALTYDHRLVDGRQSVTFLVKVKEALEDPTRILLEI